MTLNLVQRSWKCDLFGAPCWASKSSSGAISGASSVVGGLKLMELNFIPLPYWFWWAIALLALVYTVVRLQMQIDGLTDDRGRLPDMTLEEVVRRIARADALDYQGVEMHNALAEIRRQASLDRPSIEVFGVDSGQPHTLAPSGQLATKIEPAFWRDHQIDYMEFINDHGGQTSKVTLAASPGTYRLLQFHSSQVDALWPPPRTRIKWQAPIRLEKPYR